MSEEKTICPNSLVEWREWLLRNHKSERRVGVICYKKHTGKPVMSHRDLMEEAICFGWIDTTIKRIDEDKYLRNFAKRNDKSKWSDATLGYAKRLIKEKRMSPAGLVAYKHGLKRPTHDHGIPKNPEPPADLLEALSVDKKLEEKFENLAPSYRRMHLRWLARTKRSETRDKRIKSLIELLKSRKDR